MDIENGIIAKWQEEKGFGFIRPKDGGKELFFYINQYSHRHKRPQTSLEVQFYKSIDSKGRVCAIDVAPIKGHKDNGYQIRQKLNSIILLTLFCSLLYFLYISKLVPIELTYFYGIMSVLAFSMYAKDKNAAEWGRWRTSESTLHLLSVLGGWPGAAVAQSFLRHKSKKMSFRVTYWVTVITNCCALFWFTTSNGNLWLNNMIQNLSDYL